MTRHELNIDPDHSAVEFAVTFATNTVITGRFREFSGNLVFDADEPAHSAVSATIRAGSVDTGSDGRDGHLRSSDFFNIEEHEELAFKSTSIDTLGDHHWQLTGDLQLLGATRQVTLNVHYYGIVEDGMGNQRASFVAETDLHRSDFGMGWNQTQKEGLMVGERVRVSLYISATPLDNDE